MNTSKTTMRLSILFGSALLALALGCSGASVREEQKTPILRSGRATMSARPAQAEPMVAAAPKNVHATNGGLWHP